MKPLSITVYKDVKKAPDNYPKKARVFGYHMYTDIKRPIMTEAIRQNRNSCGNNPKILAIR